MRWLALVSALTGTHWFYSPSGNIQCSSATTGMRCVVVASGHGFTIARTGVRTY